MKRVITGVVFCCLLLLLAGAGWGLYQKSSELEALSERFSDLSGGYSSLSEEYETMSGEQIVLSGNYSELSRENEGLIQRYLAIRGHGKGTAEGVAFTESSKRLYNPNRGFYHLHGFYITDAVKDYRQDISGRFWGDGGAGLTLIEVNIREFRGGEISEAGLESIDNLLEALCALDKQIILRFLYDWDGKGMEAEPESLEMILRHMDQLSGLLEKYQERIFIVQGLFVGNVGEMNGSKYLGTEDMQRLAGKLLEVTGENTYLSVRTPAQWRCITNIPSLSGGAWEEDGLASRMGLYNDGMLGSWTDYGTYGVTDQTPEERPFSQWNRHEELDFQDVLCRLTPNGGEVIVDNEYNDFERALEDMKKMHVTYLNWDHDASVINKWRKATIQENGCFDGMDGRTYVERHLGYRLVLRDAALDYDWREDVLTAQITLQNVGFAPVYREAETRLVLYDRARGREYVYYLDSEQDVRELVGGTESEEQMTLRWEAPVGGLLPGEIEVYFVMTDVLSNERIQFGNEQEPEVLGYRVGTLTLEETDGLWEQINQ